MNRTLQRLLDGALAPEEAAAWLASLGEPERLEALRLLRIARAARALPDHAPAPGFEAAAMARVRARPAPRRSAWAWLHAPRLSPLGAGGLALVAASAAALTLAIAHRRPAPPAAPAAEVVARLTLTAPQARQVSVAGDFNGWSPEAAPLRRGPGGAWTGEVRLPRGRHQYMFVVDGEWVTDPAAPATLDDGFGHRNAVLDL